MLKSPLPLFAVFAVPFGVIIGWLQWLQIRRARRWRRPFHDMARPAGWSLQDRVEDLQGYMVIDMMMAPCCGLIGWSLQEPSAMIVGGLGSVAFTYRAIQKIRRAADARLGLRGEQLVGQMLDRHTSSAFHVFHDLEIKEGSKKPWNIDHVVVTASGVFAIETKTRRKPVGASEDHPSHRVIFDGLRLIFPPPLKRDSFSVDQTKRAADWLAEKLAKLNGIEIAVTPVLVLPGWWVDIKGKGDVCVLNPKGIARFLEGRHVIHSPERFRAICGQLDELCRVKF
jgi:hypothetical protein